MRGVVVSFDPKRDTGVIQGDNGLRYAFVTIECHQPILIREGVQVDFAADGETARLVWVIKSGDEEERCTEIFSASSRMGSAKGLLTPSEALSLWQYFLKVKDWRSMDWRALPGRGRSRRKEYWGFCIFATLLAGPLYFLGRALTDGDFERWYFMLPFIAVAFYLLPGSVNVSVRRLHDVGMSGWFFAINLVPYAGPLFWLLTSVWRSQPVPNKWGPPPR